MSERFAEAIPRLAGLAAQALGWRPHDFWNATPAELAMSLASPDSAAAQPMTRQHLDTLLEQDHHGHR